MHARPKCSVRSVGLTHQKRVGDLTKWTSQASPEDYAKFFTCVMLSGPVLVGYTQTLNDWYDKDLDAINEPYRPIPSGRITEDLCAFKGLCCSSLGASFFRVSLLGPSDCMGSQILRTAFGSFRGRSLAADLCPWRLRPRHGFGTGPGLIIEASVNSQLVAMQQTQHSRAC